MKNLPEALHVSEHEEKSRRGMREQRCYWLTVIMGPDVNFLFLYFRFLYVLTVSRAEEWQAIPFVFPYISTEVCEV